LEEALYGSFLPVPSLESFPLDNESDYSYAKTPGAVIVKKEKIVINKDRERIKLKVVNFGDRPIQVSLIES
jgi:urease